MLYWGLVPVWAKDKSIGARMINARAETLREKPAFRDAYRKRRALVPADGYYEWMQLGPRDKQPYFIRPASGAPFALGGAVGNLARPGHRRTARIVHADHDRAAEVDRATSTTGCR